METLRVWYANVFVSDLERAIRFYRDVLGLALQQASPAHGYASFDAGPIRLGLARTEGGSADGSAILGRHTGLGFGVADLERTYQLLREKGAAFTVPPERQPWGGFMALFRDPDGNVFYLDQLRVD